MDRRPELRRALTLSEQLSTPTEPAIRDFLKAPHDDDDDDDAEETPCTLMDAIDREIRGEGSAGGAINWKPLRYRLLLRRAWHATGSTTKPPPAGSSSKYHCSTGAASVAVAFSRAPSLRAAVDEDVDSDVEEEEEEEGNDEPPAAASTSLMALLEQADGHWDGTNEVSGASQCSTVEAEDHGKGRREEEEEEMEMQACCVCMLRHKGAAFIPCGHTFCRLCSRELWLKRATCPLCNVFIQDILHIF